MDHAWIRIDSAPGVGGQQGPGHAVILDAWADGPVIDPSDGEFSNDSMLLTAHTIDAKDGLSAYQAFQREMVASYETQIAALANKIQMDLNTKYRTAGSSPEEHPLLSVVQWDAVAVLGDRFLSELKLATLTGLGDVELKSQALRIARRSPSWPKFKDTENLAAIIIAATRSLGAATDRFLVPFTPVSMGLVPPSNDITDVAASPPPEPEAPLVRKISRTLSY